MVVSAEAVRFFFQKKKKEREKLTDHAHLAVRKKRDEISARNWVDPRSRSRITSLRGSAGHQW